MNILCLHGSPRKKGNSADMARIFLDTAREAGAEVESVHLNGLEAKGCQACFACKGASEVCVLEDGLTPVLESARACDVLVLATPVYFGEVSAQLKTFIDRTFSFLTPEYARDKEHRSRLSPGKTLVFLIAQGHPREDLFADIFPRYQFFFNWLGFTKSHVVRACGVYHPGDVQARPDLVKELAALGQRIVSGT
ncbi:NAD(P)H-dependent oxidoreductase [Desulfovibrio aminophilus]|uniref:flavodoxin family protein n=1 Tax=Desulfovibrio aminophilus TaxID=81425 RepID=UPI0033999E7B